MCIRDRSRSLYEMLGELQKEVQPNKITVTEHIAVVAAVGRKMAYRPGVSGKIFAKPVSYTHLRSCCSR